MDDLDLVTALTASFTRQSALYTQLLKTSQKTLSALVLSRGDLTSIVPRLEKKQALLDEIGREREECGPLVNEYAQRRDSIRLPEESTQLNTCLGETEQLIQDFLKIEDQIQTYLKGMMSPAGGQE